MKIAHCVAAELPGLQNLIAAATKGSVAIYPIPCRKTMAIRLLDFPGIKGPESE